MEKLNKFIAKVLTIWVAIGTLLTVVSASGVIHIPEVIAQLFSKDVSDQLNIALNSIVQTIGVVINFAQVVRLIFANKQTDELKGKAISLSSGARLKYIVNPFKTHLIAA
ncbi:MAG: hypothetical protein KDD24_00805 [Flavobacteriales bacterium]|nr:hypothetical protein [Flavobacteriales bacterium]